MSPDLQLALEILGYAYDKSSWHGPTLKGTLRGVRVEQAIWRPAPGRHTIWELATHAAYWKYAVRRKLTAAKRGSFPLEGSNWFSTPAAASEAEWRKMLRLLDAEHRLLRQAIEEITPRDLASKTIRRLLCGIAAHDLYHAGQISLTRRLQTERR